MKNFVISNPIQALDTRLSHDNKLLVLGSCFSEHIGEKLEKVCFDVDVNPSGILYNPASILIALKNILNKKQFVAKDLFLSGSLWSSFQHSTLFSSPDLEITLRNINSRIEAAHKQLVHVDYLLITFGTAWIYTTKSAEEIVANCHKLPANLFNRRRLTVHEIVDDYSDFFHQIIKINPNIKLIFTVSPVRHLKDGVHENNLSKAVLHLAIDKLIKQFDFVSYFPAYEIQIDELRDYRFYAEDLVHPSNQSIDYIWECFMKFSMDSETISLNKKIETYRRMKNHRPIHSDTPEYKQFLNHLEKTKKELLEKYPFLKAFLL